MILSLSLILFGLAALLYGREKAGNKASYLQRKPGIEAEDAPVSAVNVSFLSNASLRQRFADHMAPTLDILGSKAALIISAFIVAVLSAALYVNKFFFHFDHYWLPVVILPISLFMGWQWLLKRRRNDFEQNFPDALNMMMSAITAGDSIMQAILYVGNTLDNKLGHEFRRMGERLKMGESVGQVFGRAALVYPYPAFLFFIVTIQANMSRGGQLKPVMARLIRVLVDARSLEKKKMAMTSEARLSAKIVAAIPFGFMVLLSYISPDNIQFVLSDPEGRKVLYYVVGSEAIGLGIVWLLIKAVR